MLLNILLQIRNFHKVNKVSESLVCEDRLFRVNVDDAPKTASKNVGRNQVWGEKARNGTVLGLLPGEAREEKSAELMKKIHKEWIFWI